MDKNILIQYSSLKAEIHDLQESIKSLEQKARKMESGQLLVSDSVKGTRADGTYGNIKITGLPFTYYCNQLKVLENRKEKLRAFEARLMVIVGDVDDYINGLDDSRMRRMLRYRFLDGLSWVQVAHRMDGRHTADSCRMAVERFLQ